MDVPLPCKIVVAIREFESITKSIQTDGEQRDMYFAGLKYWNELLYLNLVTTETKRQTKLAKS